MDLQMAAFAALFALLDRLCGGWPPVPGKGTYWAFPAIVLAALALGLGWSMGAALAVAFVIWRSPGWRLFGGDLAPRRDRYAGTLARHALAPVAFGLAIFMATEPQHLAPRALALLAFPPAALLLAIWIRRESDRNRDVNGWAEAARGALLGAVVALAL